MFEAMKNAASGSAMKRMNDDKSMMDDARTER
jgi:hypothetical protein